MERLSNGDEALKIDGDGPPELPLDHVEWVAEQCKHMLDGVHATLDFLACMDRRNGSLPFAADIELAIDRLADVRAHVRACYPREG